MNRIHSIERSFVHAAEAYSEWGVDVVQAMRRVRRISISLQCWQGDDVQGFEHTGSDLGGGLAVTGHYPGKARTADELRSDLEKSLSLIPGTHRLNLHASYLESEKRRVDRCDIEPRHYQSWIDWASRQGIGMDFNPTFFAHPHAESGFTLAHSDRHIREFWIQHGIASRKVAAAIGRKLGSPCINNVWIPDGFKDTPIDRQGPRQRLTESLNRIFDRAYPSKVMLDAVESKLFGLGSESYVAGSHEFYLGYAIAHRKWLCLDSGHFHPTENIADKISALAPWVEGLLLHVSRGVRWDSDHVVTLSDDLQAVASEVMHQPSDSKIRLGLDFFDASINRIAAWVIGSRALIKSLLRASLEPARLLKQLEKDGDYTGRLACLEETKTLPFGAVWDYYCLENNVPVGRDWLLEVRRYERDVLSQRS